MKELTIKEKAKAYDEALERAKEILAHTSENYLCTHFTKEDLKDMFIRFFPELQESEDEKIRKDILIVLERTATKFFKEEGKMPIWYDKALAWLENYDKQKEINLVELLKHYPKETELYSPLYGKLWLAEVDEKSEIITCYRHPLNFGCTRAILEQEDIVCFYSNGTTGLPDCTVSKDCMLFLYDIEKQGNLTDINPSEFDSRLNKLLKQFETLPKEELTSSLSFYLNVVQNGGTYREEKQGEQPRFNIGDVICDKSCTTLNKETQHNFEITDIRDGMYICDKWSIPISQQDEFELVAKKIEQKPVDKVEPKFHEGEWVVSPNGVYWHIDKISNNRYEVTSNTGECAEWPLDTNIYHGFTIQDAKDGDVLYHSDTASNGIFIFKELLEYEFVGKKVICYCDYDSEDGFCLGETYTCCWADAKILHPATKEQRDTLFAKMKEAGYEWDTEKKELKKIGQKPIDKDESILNILHKESQQVRQKDLIMKPSLITEQKSAWSEEDEAYKLLAISAIEDYYDKENPLQEDLIDWLKSLRPWLISITDEEIAQAKKNAYNDALDKIEYHSGEPTFDDGWSAAVDYIRKKSLKPQNQWKPSKKQMETLLSEVTAWTKGCPKQIVLETLYNDLKKLK